MKRTVLISVILCISVILQGQVLKTINVTAGGLKTTLTPTELSTITNLTLIGVVDARDFKTMRDDMSILAVLDLSGVTIAAYTGPEGTINSNISYSVNAIPTFAFYNQILKQGKESLISIILPASVTSINPGAFFYCFNLNSVNLTSSISSIGQNAFAFCSSLTMVTIPSSVVTLGTSAFTAIEGPINVDLNNLYFSSLDGMLLNKTQSILIQCPTSKSGNIDIPSSITSIGEYSFFACSLLTSVTIPSSVTSIGRSAFTLCENLLSIYIPPSVSSIGEEAFNSCFQLTTIYANSSTPVNLIYSPNVFFPQILGPTTLYVPYGSLGLYSSANQWKDFSSIIEMPEFKLSAYSGSAQEEGGTAEIELATGASWTATTDQAWLTISQISGTGNSTITLTVEANPDLSPRYATVTFSSINLPSQTIVISQTGSPKIINITPGGLSTALTSIELNTISNLILTGTIDARDFKTMRENMPCLRNLNLRDVTISEYTGKEGTGNSFLNGKYYPANEIPIYAFFNPVTLIAKKSLSSVILPNSANKIDIGAFMYCTGLTKVFIPPSVTLIELQAFDFASGSIIVDPDNSKYSSLEGVLFDKTLSKLIHCPTSFKGNIYIPSSVSVIGRYSFGYCSGLNSIIIPSSVTSIELGAFFYCSNLTSIIALSLSPIDLSSSPNVFYNINVNICALAVPFGSSELYAAANQWQAFTNIFELPEFRLSSFTATIPATGGTASTDIITGLSWSATSDQTWLTVNPPSGTGNQTITFSAEANSLICTRTAKVTFQAPNAAPQTIVITQPGSSKVINISAGGLSSALSPIELSTATRLNLSGTIDARDFKTMRDDMPLLAELDLSGVTIVAYSGTMGTDGTRTTSYADNCVPRNAFYIPVTEGKKNLTSVILPSSVTQIKMSSFEGCSGLTSINIPSSVVYIETFAFLSCNKLTSIILPPSLINIGEFVFGDCSGLTSVDIPATLTNIQSGAFAGCGFTNVDVGNPNYSSIDGILFNKTKTNLIHFPVSQTGSYSIPLSVTTLSQNAFRSCVNLTSVKIANTVSSIEFSAFRYCTGLQSIYAYSESPVSLSSSSNTFYGVDKAKCILYVPMGATLSYSSSDIWKDFSNIIEMPGLKVSATVANISAGQGSTISVDITSNVSWSLSSDKSWLTVNPSSGNGNSSITFTAEANPIVSARIATVTVTGTEVGSQTIAVKQDGVPTGINITENSSINIYPNPVKDFLIIKMGDFSENSDYTIKIIGPLGKIVFEAKATQAVNEINTSSWFGKGVYFLQVYNKNSLVAVKKIILQ